MFGYVDFGDGPIGAAGLRSFIARFDTDGEHLWSRLISDGEAGLSGVAVDGLGSLLLVGDFWGTADFGGGALTSEGDQDVFLVKLGSDGQHVWSKRFGDPLAQQGRNVAGSGAGNVAVTGLFLDSIDLGGGVVQSAGEYDGFVAVFGP